MTVRHTLIFSVFRSLSLAHLERSLYSLSRQTVRPDEMLLFDNASPHSEDSIRAELQKHFKLSDWSLYFAKHNDPRKTLTWGNNRAIQLSNTDCFVFCRADYIYDFQFYERVLAACNGNQLSFSTAWMWGMPYFSGKTHDTVDHASDLEPLQWRNNTTNLLRNFVGARPEMNSHIDGPTFCTTKTAMHTAGWYDESLQAWGFGQQNLQTAMAMKGVKIKVIPEFLYFHMNHPDGEHEWDKRNPERAMAEWCKSPRRTAQEREWMTANSRVLQNPNLELRPVEKLYL